jgi:hypothetical protein
VSQDVWPPSSSLNGGQAPPGILQAAVEGGVIEEKVRMVR